MYTPSRRASSKTYRMKALTADRTPRKRETDMPFLCAGGRPSPGGMITSFAAWGRPAFTLARGCPWPYWTQQQIAQEVQLDQVNINRTIMQFFTDEISHNPPDSLQVYNIWEFAVPSLHLPHHVVGNAIAKELGVNHRTIGRWLNNGNNTQGIMPNPPILGHNALRKLVTPRYLVVNQGVEKLRIIICGNISFCVATFW